MQISKTVCISQITGAALNRRTAFHVEMAVGLAVYATAGKVNKASRATLYEIYESAGYDCGTAQGADYRVVHRRISGAGDLFKHIGQADLDKWVNGFTGVKALQLIVDNIKHLDIRTLNEVLAVAGKGPAGGGARGPAPGYRIDLEHVHVVIPPTATHAELIDLAMKIVAYAEEKMKTAA